MSNAKSTRICSVDGCTSAHYGKGFCRLHYGRWYRNGTLELKPDVCWKFLRDLIGTAETDCVIWPYRIQPDGYGKVSYKQRTAPAHRVMLMLCTPQPPDRIAGHQCRNKACVNPNHLGWITPEQNNNEDKIRDGTSLRGKRNPLVRLTEEQIPVIRKLREHGLSYMEIAKLYDVGKSTIFNVVTKRTWRYLQ